MAGELPWLDIDITALSKVHFAEQGSLRCWLHVQNLHRQKIAELASWSFRLHHVPKTPNLGQVCHYPQCVRTYSAG